MRVAGLAGLGLAIVGLCSGVMAPSARAGEVEVPESVGALLESLRVARTKGGRALVALFDPSALAKRVERLLPEGDRSAATRLALRIAVPMALAEPDLIEPVARQKVVSWRPPADGEPGVVAMRVVDAEGVSMAERYWLVARGEGWRIVDWELVEVGMPFSLLLTIGLSEALRGEPKLRAYVERLEQARGHLDAGDLDQAEAVLVVDPGFTPSPVLESMRHAMLGAVLVAAERPEEGLSALEKALRVQPDLPVAHLGRAQALYSLERYAEAAEAAQAYLAQVGEDPDGLALLGSALLDLGHGAQAAAAALRGLREDPGSVDLLYLAAAGAEGEVRTEVIALLRAHPDWPEAALQVVELEFALTVPALALQTVADALAAGAPTAPLASIYAAAALLRSERAGLGRDKLLAVLERKDVGELRNPVRDLLVEALAEVTPPVRASVFGRVPAADRPYVFTGLACARASALDGPGLKALLEKARALKHAGPDLPYFEADLATLEKRYEEALTWLDRVLVPEALPEDGHPWLESVLGAWSLELRVRALLRLGRHADALVPAKRYAAQYETQRALLIVHAVAGKVEDATRAFNACVAEDYDPEQLLDDPDAGPLLRGPAYKALRAKHGLPE